MTKHMPPPMKMKVERGRLVPATAYDSERLDSYRVGSTVNVRFTADRMRPLERKYRAILGKVVKECDTPWTNAETAHQAIKLSCGIVNVGKTKNGEFFQWPRSLVDLDDKEMEDYFNDAMAVLEGLTGVDVETMKRETAHVAEDDHDPETGEIHEPADEPSPSASSADDAVPPASSEPAGSSSLPAGSTNTNAEENPASASGEPQSSESSPANSETHVPGSPDQFRFDPNELTYLKEFVSKALKQAADPTLGEAAKLFDLEGMDAGYRGGVISSPDGVEALDAALIAIKAVIAGKRTRELATNYIARDILGCAATELEGRK